MRADAVLIKVVFTQAEVGCCTRRCIPVCFLTQNCVVDKTNLTIPTFYLAEYLEKGVIYTSREKKSFKLMQVYIINQCDTNQLCMSYDA